MARRLSLFYFSYIHENCYKLLMRMQLHLNLTKIKIFFINLSPSGENLISIQGVKAIVIHMKIILKFQ